MEIFEELEAVAASVPADAWEGAPPSDATILTLWAEVRKLRQDVAEAATFEREACAALVEGMVSTCRELSSMLPPPYPRSYFYEAAQQIRKRGQDAAPSEILRMARARELLAACLKNTNLRHDIELRGLADEVLAVVSP
jgi:hypothetical protein